MNWKAVKEDTYYRGRKMEKDARKASDPRLWEAYGALKARKGSYTLGVHGYLNAAGLYASCSQTAEAVRAYEEGLSIAIRGGYMELAVIVAYRLAQIHEDAKEWDASIAVYERLATFCEDRDAYFLAADAYEHAAEMMALAGRDVTRYTKPITLWEKNIKHWQAHGHEHDAVWSREHIDLYRKLFGVTA